PAVFTARCCASLENVRRYRLLLCLLNGKPGFPDPDLCGELSRLAVKGHGGSASGQADHLAIAPPHAMIPARAQSFHGRFLGGEARGITLHAIGLGIAIPNFSGSINALQEALPETLDGLADAGNFGDVDARAYDHDQKPWQ